MKELHSQVHRLFVPAAFLLAISIVLFTLPVRAQTTNGTINGTVTDASGALISGAQVTLTSLGTSEKRTQTTGSDGLYLFPNLVPGRYSIDIEKTGFKKYSRPDVVVEVNQTARIDAIIQVGDVNQVVEVTGETPLIQTETSSLGTVVGERTANELPLNGRNIFNLTTVTPSVVAQGNTEGTVVGKNPFDFANYQIGGSFANEGAIYLDGEPLNTGYINLPLVVPTQDSVSEFKVQYNNLGPEWGKFAGGVINMSTKAGTNELHGELYEYLRNRVLNANEFFNKTAELQSGQPNKAPPFTQNQFGGTIGGAAIKNKTFFFGSYEGFRLRSGTVYTTTVMTPCGANGRFLRARTPNDLRSAIGESELSGDEHLRPDTVSRQHYSSKPNQSDLELPARPFSAANQQCVDQQFHHGGEFGWEYRSVRSSCGPKHYRQAADFRQVYVLETAQPGTRSVSERGFAKIVVKRTRTARASRLATRM